MTALVYVGASTESVREAGKVILAILAVKGREEETIRSALNTLHSVCRVEGTRIENCTFSGAPERKAK